MSDRFPAAGLATLAAVVDRIVPADDFPAGAEAGVLDYFERQFGRQRRGRQDVTSSLPGRADDPRTTRRVGSTTG